MMESLGANLATWRAGHMATAGIWIRPFGNHRMSRLVYRLFWDPVGSREQIGVYYIALVNRLIEAPTMKRRREIVACFGPARCG